MRAMTRAMTRATRRLTRTLAGLALGAVAVSVGAPGCSEPPPPGLEVQPLELHEVGWNPKGTPVGRIAAAAELLDDTLVLGDQGALVFTGGVLLSSDAAVRSWRTAAVVPAGDKSGQWLIGIAEDGKVRRLRSRSTMEDVSDRYGLKDRVVQGAADLGQGLVGFTLAGVAPAGGEAGQGPVELAVADGTQVQRYAVALPELRGSGPSGTGRAVGITARGSEGQVVVFSAGSAGAAEAASGTPRAYAVRDPVAADFLPDGRLVVAAAHSLYVEGAGDPPELERIHASEEPIHSLAVAGPVVWLSIGRSLAQLDGQTLRLAEVPAGPSAEVEAAEAPRLTGMASGDVWLHRGGGLRRFAIGGDTQADSARWEREVRPIFTRLCSLCHLPGGSASIDLSTYRSWASRRALLEQRVLLGKPSPMPPAGAGTLTPDEAAILRDWLGKK